MQIRFVAAAIVAAAVVPQQQLRKLTPVPLTVTKPLAHITAAHELTNGKILVSDVHTPALWLLDPATGIAAAVGAPGASPDQFAQPGGFYTGANNTILLADHSGPRALVLSVEGKITGGYSTARQGIKSSSDSDFDEAKLDARGFVYSADRGAAFRDLAAGVSSGLIDLIRLDPVKQTREPIAKLMVPKERQVNSGNGMIFTRSVVGDPADGWGVMANGRIAIVRAAPYRVEWLSPDGKSTLGPIIAVDPIPFTDADRREIEKNSGRGGASVGEAGGAAPKSSSADLERQYAAVKPPFKPTDVIISPAGRVWVLRQQAFGSPTVHYDVFDTTGARVDRVEFPANSRVIGFGPASVLVREGGDASAVLRKYKLS